jgi:hypothetical protein
MTTGDTSVDLRSDLTLVPHSGTQKVGVYFRKVWSGADSAPPPTKRYQVLHKAFESSILRHDGKPYVIPEYRQRVASPSSVRMREEHALTCNLSTSLTGVIRLPSTGYYYSVGASSVSTPVTVGSGAPGSGVPLTWTANDQIVLVNRLRARMQGSEWDPAVFLAGASQSLHLIAESAVRLNIGMRYLRKGNVSGAMAAWTRGTSTKDRRYHPNVPKPNARDLANLQLELSYGWLPLMSDAYEGAGYLAHHMQTASKTSYRATYKRRLTNDTNFINFSGVSAKTSDSFVFGQIIARMSEDWSFSTTQLAGLDDPLGMAWERLPWSFVADWFIPISNYLQARAFAKRVTGTFITTTGYRRRYAGLTTSGPFVIIDPGYSYRGLSMSRSISSSLSVPIPKLKPFSSVPSWRRAANAVSLLIQRQGSSASSGWATY